MAFLANLLAAFLLVSSARGIAVVKRMKVITTQNNCDLLLHRLVRYNYLNKTSEAIAKNKSRMYDLNCNMLLPIQLAIENDNVEMLKLFQANNFSMNVKVGFGNSLVHYAVSKGALKSVKSLLNMSLNGDSTNEMNQTPLAKAIQIDEQDMVNILLASGVDIGRKTHLGDTYLHIAARYGSAKALKALFKSDLQHGNYRYQLSVLKLAVLTDKTKILELLKSKSFNINEKESFNGRTLLHIAAYGGKHHSLQWLLKNGLNIDQKDRNAMTPLHYAVISGNLACVKEILRNRADINAKDIHGHTPLYYAVLMSHKDVREFLTDRGGLQ